MASDDAVMHAIVVGFGCPLRSMGWYHAEQLLASRCPSVQLLAIVEPFYMTCDPATPGADAFHAWKESHANIPCFASVSDIPASLVNDTKWMVILSARTADNPDLFQACMKLKCPCLYLEKPGAPTVDALTTMRDQANEVSCKVYMGFNKNVSGYVHKTLEHAKAQTDTNVTFLHNNDYKKEELPECFERNAEGMLKNMAIHELALLATYYNVSVDTIEAVNVDAEYSSCQTLVGPSSKKEFTDFDKLKFQIITTSGASACVAADRCGGSDSVGIVTKNDVGELARFVMPDAETVANVPNLEKLYPGAMPYFFTQDPDYCALKETIAQAFISGRIPQGVATIDTAIDTLKLAEHLTPILQQQLAKP